MEDNIKKSINDRKTLLIVLSALFVAGAFAGCAIYRLLGLGENELYDSLIERYFVSMFYKCTKASDVFFVVSDCVLHELVLFAIVFAGGFTVFTTAVSSGIILYRGVLFGFALTMLQFSTKTGLLLSSICYIGEFAVISFLLMLLSGYAFTFYYPKRSPKLRDVNTKNYFLCFLRICGLVFVNVSVMIFLIYVYL